MRVGARPADVDLGGVAELELNATESQAATVDWHEDDDVWPKEISTQILMHHRQARPYHRSNQGKDTQLRRRPSPTIKTLKVRKAPESE